MKKTSEKPSTDTQVDTQVFIDANDEIQHVLNKQDLWIEGCPKKNGWYWIWFIHGPQELCYCSIEGDNIWVLNPIIRERGKGLLGADDTHDYEWEDWTSEEISHYAPVICPPLALPHRLSEFMLSRLKQYNEDILENYCSPENREEVRARKESDIRLQGAE